MRSAAGGVDTAFYLVHALGSGGDLWREETEAAENFARAAERAGVRRIVYLGGLGDGDAGCRRTLRRVRHVGKILREQRRRTLEFRASIILGSGSLSFEMIRALVERLPVMVTPRVGAASGAADRHRGCHRVPRRIDRRRRST